MASGLLDIALLTVSAPWPLGRPCVLAHLAYCPLGPAYSIHSRMLGTCSVLLSLTVDSCDLLEHSQHGGLYSCHHLWLISDLRFLLGVSVGTLPR